jgi:hypothetical protein
MDDVDPARVLGARRSETIELVVVEDRSVAAERIAVAGYLAGYTRSTRRSYATDLRLFAAWCREGHQLVAVRQSRSIRRSRPPGRHASMSRRSPASVSLVSTTSSSSARNS